MNKRGQGPQFRHIHRRIERANLNRSEARRWANIPANLVEIRDPARALQALLKIFDLLPRIQQVWQASGRQLVEHHRAVVGVSRVNSVPEGGRGRERLQDSQPRDKRVMDGRNLFDVFNSDVDVSAEDDHLATPVLGALHEFFVARSGANFLVRWG